MYLEEMDYKLTLGRIIQLFQIDLSPVGGGTLYFTPNSPDASGVPVKFNGISYYPVDLLMDGFEMATRGTLPRPTIKIANTTNLISDLISQYKDLVGSKITRIRTYEAFIDGAPAADPTNHYPIDQFVIMQKSMQTKLYVEFTLAASIDVEGQKLPRRIVLHNFCGRQYRRWDATNGVFDYSKASCPYTGSSYFKGNRSEEVRYGFFLGGSPDDTVNDTPTSTASEDKCSKTMGGCLRRFAGQPLPAWFFPGAGRF